MKTQLMIKLEKELKEQFQAVCKANCLNASEVVRRLIEDFLAREGRLDE